MKFFIYKGTITSFFLALSLMSIDAAVGLVGKSPEDAIKEICNGRVKGVNENVDNACKVWECGGQQWPC